MSALKYLDAELRKMSEAGYVVIGAWGDHLHGYRLGYLLAPPGTAERVLAEYEANEIRDDSELSAWYGATGCVWVAESEFGLAVAH